MRESTCFAVALSALALACSGGGGGDAPRLGDVTSAGATLSPGTAEASCPAGTDACGGSGFCCPTGTACLANPNDALGCGSEYCCAGCSAGSTCGAGCCPSDSHCVANPGGATGCATGLCCSPTPEPQPCPTSVAAECPAGTRCLENRSARYCPGGYACYLASGAVGCPGESLCPNGVDFCPADTYCAAVAGVCPTGSSSGNYCCKAFAQAGESCDSTECAPGLSCVTNGGCPDQDGSAAKVCKGACGGSYPVDCGGFCCSASYPVCGGAGSCECWVYW